MLKQFHKKYSKRSYCFVYLLTNRKLEGMWGIANRNGLCSLYGNNVGLSKFFTRGTQSESWNDRSTINIMAHEIAHLFGAQHSGPECPISPGIMGQMKYRNFTKCALEQMDKNLHNVYEDENNKRHLGRGQCFDLSEAITSSNYRISDYKLYMYRYKKLRLKNPCK